MNPYLQLFLVVVLLIGLSFAGIAIKMFFKKGGEFKKSCSTVDPQTGKPMGCSCGGREDSCENTGTTHRH
ncbi:MAG: membrane or secreted protein [Bacteroidales bacterium]|nr:membrane or secreted protein [Bacteroidales bacterium]